MPVSCFRRCKGQLSEDYLAYRKECAEISPDSGALLRRLVRMHFARHEKLPKGARTLLYRLLFGQHPFNLVEFSDRGTPLLKSVRSYVV